MRFSASLNFSLSGASGYFALRLDVKHFEGPHSLSNLRQLQQLRFVAVVQIGGAVGDLVGQVDELRFQRRPLIEQVFG